MTNLKLTQENFEYFLLQVAHDTSVEAIKAKLESFKQFVLAADSSPIVIAFANDFVYAAMIQRLAEIIAIMEQLQLKLHAVAHNQCLGGKNIEGVTNDTSSGDSIEHIDRVCGVQIIDLPSVAKVKASPHIYNQSLIVSEPVRSGMKIENDGDIIVTSFVSDNAELVASGNIHIYGEARGRLIAGAGDNTNKHARIFVTKFNAELVSIGGTYRLLDERLPENILHKPVMISLNDKGRLLINRLDELAN